MTLPLTTAWDLGRYYYSGLDDPKLTQDIGRILPTIEAFRAKWENTLKEINTAKALREFYDESESLSHLFQRPGEYLFYRSSLDTQDTEISKKIGELQYIGVQVSDKLLFISQAWKHIGYNRLIELSEDILLAPYRNAIVKSAEEIRYILSEKEEKVLNAKSRPLSVVDGLREELVGSYTFEMDGKEMTEEEVRTLRQAPDRETRRKAYASLRSVYNTKANQIVLGNTYSAIIKDSVSEVDIRGYTSVMGPRNTSEQLEDAVVNTLIDEVVRAYPLFHRYLEAKRKLLKLDTIAIWDTLAPIGGASKKIPYEDAVTLHLDTMQAFDEEFFTLSRDLLTSGRIDVHKAHGKRGGAFCSSSQGEPVFVLLNYTESARDVSTLSHELGHAIHGELSQVQTGAVYHPPLSLAETASIFSEMLLSENLKKTLSSEEKLAFLDENLSDLFATIFRQIQYITFEREAHESIRKGEELTYKEFNALWRKHQKALYGNSVEFDVPDTEESGWSMIPHIFSTPFYCYAYSFGNLLTLALYDKYLHEGASFIPKYKELLRAGGSKKPDELLRENGFDIYDPEFFRGGLRQVEKLVEEFELFCTSCAQ